MAWFKLDDSITFHPKMLSLSGDAGWLWTRAGAWCAQQLTDGFFPGRMLPALAATDKAVAELVDAGLWLEEVDGFRFHDWADYQPTREKVLEERARTKARQQAWRERNAVTDSVTKPVSNKSRNASRNGARNAVSNAAPRDGAPTRPDPSSSQSVVTLEALLTSAGDKVATTTTIKAWAAKNTPDVDLDTETAAFLAKNAGKQLHDPTAAWKAWMRAARPASERVTVPAGPQRVTTVGLPPPADAARCDVDGHEHELAGHCRICAADALEATPLEPDPSEATR